MSNMSPSVKEEASKKGKRDKKGVINYQGKRLEAEKKQERKTRGSIKKKQVKKSKINGLSPVMRLKSKTRSCEVFFIFKSGSWRWVIRSIPKNNPQKSVDLLLS